MTADEPVEGRPWVDLSNPDLPSTMAKAAGVPDWERIIAYQPSAYRSCRIWTWRDGATYCSVCKDVSAYFEDDDV